MLREDGRVGEENFGETRKGLLALESKKSAVILEGKQKELKWYEEERGEGKE